MRAFNHPVKSHLTIKVINSIKSCLVLSVHNRRKQAAFSSKYNYCKTSIYTLASHRHIPSHGNIIIVTRLWLIKQYQYVEWKLFSHIDLMSSLMIPLLSVSRGPVQCVVTHLTTSVWMLNVFHRHPEVCKDYPHWWQTSRHVPSSTSSPPYFPPSPVSESHCREPKRRPTPHPYTPREAPGI